MRDKPRQYVLLVDGKGQRIGGRVDTCFWKQLTSACFGGELLAVAGIDFINPASDSNWTRYFLPTAASRAAYGEHAHPHDIDLAAATCRPPVGSR